MHLLKSCEKVLITGLFGFLCSDVNVYYFDLTLPLQIENGPLSWSTLPYHCYFGKSESEPQNCMTEVMKCYLINWPLAVFI